MFRLVRRLLFGPRPKRTVFVNWGQTGNPNPFDQRNTGHDQSKSNEPHVGRFRGQESAGTSTKKLENVQDADFEEIKN